MRCLRSARATIGIDRGGVGEDAGHAARNGRRAVRATQHQTEQASRHDRSEHREVGAQVRARIDAESENGAVSTSDELRVLDVVAPVGGGNVVLAARFDPLDGLIQAHREGGDDHLFGIEVLFRAEPSADLRGDHSQRVLGHAEHAGKLEAHQMRNLG